MGLWNFVKDAGKSLFGSKAEAAEAPKEDVLRAELKDLGLDATGVEPLEYIGRRERLDARRDVREVAAGHSHSMVAGGLLEMS